MKILLTFLLFIVATCSNREGDNLPSHISKDANFLDVNITVQPVSKKEIWTEMSIKNNSKDSILLYKPLFPIDGQMKSPSFSIFSAKTYKEVPYLGPTVRYVNQSDADEGESIIPNISRDKFFVLHSQETVLFKINIAKFYDFESFDSGEEFRLVPAIAYPDVSFDYQQVFETYSADIKKPVFYFITLPTNDNIDSMRVKFKLP
jgi:hypothetical protein